MKVGLSRLLALVVLVGCSGCARAVTFPTLGPVTTVTISGPDGSHPIATITDAQTISQIVTLVDSHRAGWGTPWYGIPVPVVSTHFYKGSKFMCSFGVGEEFLETNRNGGFFSQNTSSNEVRHFLDLVGVNPSTFQMLKSR